MLCRIALVGAILAVASFAQDESSATDEGTGSAVTLTGSNTASITFDGANYVAVTTGITYASDGETITFTSTDTLYSRPTDLDSALASITGNASSTGNSTTAKPTSTLLVGGQATGTGNSSMTSNVTSTTSSARPTNTVPCNGYREFCTRPYSNITHVAAHNSPFVRPGNIATNQELPVLSQLNDGVRMLQFQVHDKNGTLQLCHTSCQMLDVGSLEDYLRTVYEWMQQNPYDVITILMGNYDVLPPARFEEPIRASGLLKYAYTPPKRPMGLSDWPELGEMILRQQRVIFMLDYEANQEEIPWLIDEFSYVWETPFSPTERDFPCTVQRPPDQPRDVSDNRMYMANHNLNLEVAIAGTSLLIPASNFLNETNAVTGYGSAGWQVSNCTDDWNRPPNYLLVDYYNVGSFNGSIFQVAATANNVSYDRDSCCDTSQRSFGNGVEKVAPGHSFALLVLAVAMVVFI
jgi:hypothetical protein